MNKGNVEVMMAKSVMISKYKIKRKVYPIEFPEKRTKQHNIK